MESTEKEITRKLKKHLKGITAATLDALAKRLGVLPAERMLLTTDIGISLAALNLRAAVEMVSEAVADCAVVMGAEAAMPALLLESEEWTRAAYLAA